MKRTFHSPRATRGGFTLFEVMMALALSAMLLAAVLAALDLAIRMSVATPRSLQSAERSAALLRALAADLRRIDAPREISAADARTRSVTDERDVDGLLGGDTWIAGRIREPLALPTESRDRSTSQAGSGAAWFVYGCSPSGRGGFSLPAALRRPACLSGRLPEFEGIARIHARDDGDLARSEKGADRGGPSCEPLASDLRCRFRYHDGLEWLSEWNRRELPVSIEITLEPADSPRAQDRSEAESSKEHAWRMVVSLADRTPTGTQRPQSERSWMVGGRR